MAGLAEIGNESVVGRTVYRYGFHAKGLPEERVEEVLDNVQGENRVYDIALLAVCSPWNVAVGQREVEQAKCHQVHADKVGVATEGGQEFVLRKD